jgi:glycosyltransferase involved in cell wall biosynthesis
MAAVVSPHCAYLPLEFANSLLSNHSMLFPPSVFCQKQLRSVVPTLASHVVRHGVDPAFRPLSDEEKQTIRWNDARARLRGPGVNFVHLAAGDLERKSTPLLMEVFARGLKRGLEATLTCVIGGIDLARMAMLARDLDPENGERIRVVPRLNAAPEQLRWFYAVFDCVIQPSRVEGFGMCPLEALCCGVPVVATTGSGHDEWMSVDKGVVPVPTDALLSPMPSEPLPCPTVGADTLDGAIGEAVWRIKTLTIEAMEASEPCRHGFAWHRVISTPQVQDFFCSCKYDGGLRDSSRRS